MRKILAVFSLCSFLACASFAQNTGSNPSDAETIKALMQEVKELKARVAALEAKQAQQEQSKPVAPEAAKQTEAPTQPEAVKQTEAPATEEANSNTNAERLSGIFPGIRIAGFGALSYKSTDARPPEASLLGFKHGTNSSFAIGDVDLFLTSHLTAKSMVLSEVVFSETPEQEFEVDVERLLLKYDFNDYLKLSFGRFHTGTSYYNSVFHHGQWLQTAADRPLVVEFSDHGGLLPSQAVGLSMTGRIPSGALGLNYLFEYGTSDTIRPNIIDPSATEIEEENGQGTTVGLFAKPDWLQGLDVGGSFYHDRINPNGGPFHIGQSIASGHVVYLTPRFEFLNEGFLIQHKVEETGRSFNIPAFYSLISEKFGEKWRPYFRYQYVNSPVDSPVFPDINLRHGPSVGLRYDYNDYIAFKTQYDRTFRRVLPDFNDLWLQLAFRF
jgi:hypothetical protein